MGLRSNLLLAMTASAGIALPAVQAQGEFPAPASSCSSVSQNRVHTYRPPEGEPAPWWSFPDPRHLQCAPVSQQASLGAVVIIREHAVCIPVMTRTRPSLSVSTQNAYAFSQLPSRYTFRFKPRVFACGCGCGH